MRTKREPSGIFATRFSFPIARPVTVILCFPALSTKTERFPCFFDYFIAYVKKVVKLPRLLIISGSSFFCDITQKAGAAFEDISPCCFKVSCVPWVGDAAGSCGVVHEQAELSLGVTMEQSAQIAHILLVHADD